MSRLTAGAARLLLVLALAAPTGALAESHYISPSAVDLAVVLPPPPAPDSATQQKDMQEVLHAQDTRTPSQVETALGDFRKSIYRFSDILGPGFAPGKLPLTDAMFHNIQGDEGAIVRDAKEHFMRPRPFTVNMKVSPLVLRPGGGGYPSGHATFAYLAAIILGDMVPEKRAALFDRAATFAETRVISGEHYPTDVEAGRITGSLIANALLQSPKFQADLAKSRDEVRTALGLPTLAAGN